MRQQAYGVAVLDYLVPAISGEAYGDRGPLDDLPVGVWLTSNILPATMNRSFFLPTPTLGVMFKVYDPRTDSRRAAKPSDFRYRVVVDPVDPIFHVDLAKTKVAPKGERRVQRAVIQTDNSGRTYLRVGSLGLGNSDLLAKVQHQAFASAAAVDPKQDWQVKGEIDRSLFLGGILSSGLSKAVLLSGVAYGLYRISTRKASKGK
jgi:hypothetical protein